jgi:hypothetical protein
VPLGAPANRHDVPVGDAGPGKVTYHHADVGLRFEWDGDVVDVLPDGSGKNWITEGFWPTGRIFEPPTIARLRTFADDWILNELPTHGGSR